MSNSNSTSFDLDDIAVGAMRPVVIDGHDIVVCRLKDGIFAVDNICTHAYARLSEGRLRGSRLICPLHGAAFDVRDGRAMGAPASKPLVQHRVTVEDGHVNVTLADSTVPAQDLPR